jgi:hypothetical protein
MARSTRWLIGIATGLLLAVPLGTVEARTFSIRFESNFAGTALTTDIDLYPTGAPDGVKAVWSTDNEIDTSGITISTSQAMVEVLPQGATPACPGGVFIVDITDPNNKKGFGVSTTTFPNGDQTYNQIFTRTQCNDAQGGFTGSQTGKILGGTGQYAGASGTFTQRFAGLTWVADPNVKQGFFPSVAPRRERSSCPDQYCSEIKTSLHNGRVRRSYDAQYTRGPQPVDRLAAGYLF